MVRARKLKIDKRVGGVNGGWVRSRSRHRIANMRRAQQRAAAYRALIAPLSAPRHIWLSKS